jgi:predicted nucleic acid-binding protein
VSSEDKPIIVDTNILFSALLSGESVFANLLLTSTHRFFIIEQAIVELFKHKEKIMKFSKLSEDDVVRFFHVLLKRLSLYKEDLISRENRLTAYELCRDIDETDTPHVALALELKGLLWTGDKTLRDGLMKKGFDQFFEPHR